MCNDANPQETEDLHIEVTDRRTFLRWLAGLTAVLAFFPGAKAFAKKVAVKVSGPLAEAGGAAAFRIGECVAHEDFDQLCRRVDGILTLDSSSAGTKTASSRSLLDSTIERLDDP